MYLQIKMHQQRYWWRIKIKWSHLQGATIVLGGLIAETNEFSTILDVMKETRMQETIFD